MAISQFDPNRQGSDGSAAQPALPTLDQNRTVDVTPELLAKFVGKRAAVHLYGGEFSENEVTITQAAIIGNEIVLRCKDAAHYMKAPGEDRFRFVALAEVPAALEEIRVPIANALMIKIGETCYFLHDRRTYAEVYPGLDLHASNSHADKIHVIFRW